MRLPRLVVNQLSIRYGDRVVVSDMSLSLAPGEIVALVGPNGCGKSSTLSALAGLIDPEGGSIEFNGLCAARDRRAYRASIGWVPQEPALIDELSLKANLLFFGRLLGLRGRELRSRIEEAIEEVDLRPFRRAAVGTFSGGMKRRANLAAALLHRPRVLLLDEPTAALDHASRQQLRDSLERRRAAGCTIFFSTHHAEESSGWTDRVFEMDAGRIVAAHDRPDAGGETILGEWVHLPMWAELFALVPKIERWANLERQGRFIRLTIRPASRRDDVLATLDELGPVFRWFRPVDRLGTDAEHAEPTVLPFRSREAA